MEWKDEVLALLGRPFAECEFERDLVAPLPAVVALRPQADIAERRVAGARRERLAAESQHEAFGVEQRTVDILAHEEDIRRALDRREHEIEDMGFMDRLSENLPLAVGVGGLGAVGGKAVERLIASRGEAEAQNLGALIGVVFSFTGILVAGSATPKSAKRERLRIQEERIASDDKVRRAQTEARLARQRATAVDQGSTRDALLAGFEALPSVRNPGWLAERRAELECHREPEELAWSEGAPQTRPTSVLTKYLPARGASAVPQAPPRRTLGEPDDFTPCDLLGNLGRKRRGR